MSQDTTTQLLGLTTQYGVLGEAGRAFSAAEVDQRSASCMLKARMRVQDKVARWGGEEFLVIVESVTCDESAAIAESLRQMIEAGTGEISKTTISIKVAHSETGQGVDEILKRADEGLYAAKNSVRNKVATV